MFLKYITKLFMLLLFSAVEMANQQDRGRAEQAIFLADMLLAREKVSVSVY